jgi:benzoylsuccinyl-CoA thiolase BbsB subunit
MRAVRVLGVGTTRFGQYTDRSYVELGVEAVSAALHDAGVGWPEVQRAYCGAVAPLGPFAGNRVGRELGLTGVPIVNVDNASASGNSAFHLAYLAVATEQCDVALAFGVGQLGREMGNVFGSKAERRKFMARAYGNAMTIFALAARRRMEVFGTSPEIFGRIAQKSKQYGAMNPNSQIQREFTLEQIMDARMIADPLTLPMCCPVGDGAAAVVVTSNEVADRLGGQPAVTVRTSMMFGETFEQDAAWGHAAMVAKAAEATYEASAVSPQDFDVVQLHDATANEELEYYEALGLCPVGEADKLVMEGATGLGGSIPVNTDGGLISRGHPLGPTGCAQVHEMVLQLRNTAGPRQVEGAKLGLIQMTGAGEVFFLHILQR